MLKHYFEFLHQGVWPPKGGGGCEVRSGTVYAHELVSGITGELMLRAMVQGYSGMVLFALYAYHNQDDSRVARWAGVSVHAVHVAVGIALRGIKYYVPKPINLETRLAWAGLLAAQDRSFISCPKT